MRPLVLALCALGCGPDPDSHTDTDTDTDTDSDADTDWDWDGVLPEGDVGIAAGYPADAGIEADPRVLFADGFEGYASAADLTARWTDAYHGENLSLSTAEVWAGSRSLQLDVPQTGSEVSNTVAVELDDEQDILFLRYHSRFAASFDVVGSSHNGGGISAHYYIDGQATPGVPADGTNKFLISFESWRGEASDPNPGRMNVYIYHPEQRSQWGDHFFPNGEVLPNTSIPGDFGPDFVPRDHVVPELGRWYAYEVMLEANTPGERDGRIACWIDGALVADFGNLRLRDVGTLTIDRFSLSLHIGSNTASATSKWYDNVVAATSYIGPTF